MLWLLALTASQVGVQLGETPGLDEATRVSLEAALSEAALDLALAKDGLFSVSALGVATRLRVTLEWTSPSTLLAPSRSVDLPRAIPEQWSARLAAVMQALAPAPIVPPIVEPIVEAPPPLPLPIQVAVTPAPPPSASLAPWITLGASAAALTGGIILGLGNRGLIARGEQSRDPAEVDRLRGQVMATGLSADLLFGSAAVLAIVSTVLFARGDEP